MYALTANLFVYIISLAPSAKKETQKRPIYTSFYVYPLQSAYHMNAETFTASPLFILILFSIILFFFPLIYNRAGC